MMSPGHWLGLTGIVLYASATSRMEAWEPGGRQVMSKATIEKVPQVHRKLLQLMWELMDIASEEGTCGWEKLWTA